MPKLPRFDPAVHYMGSVCRYGHVWQDTGQSRRFLSNRMCVECSTIHGARKPQSIIKAKWRANSLRHQNKHRTERTRYTGGDLLARLALFGGCCAYCGADLAPCCQCGASQLHWDHVDPTGADALRNLVPACRRCNQNKRDQPVSVWYPRQTFYCVERAALLARATQCPTEQSP